MSAANALSSETGPQHAAEPRPSEPSMDDILASIRRIIADDQSRHAGSSATAAGSLRRAATPAPGAPSSLPAAAAANGVPQQIGRTLPPAIESPRPSDKPSSLSRTVARGPSPRDVPEASSPPPVPLPHLNPPPLPPDLGFDRSLIDEIASAGVAAALRPASEAIEVPPAAAPAAAAEAPPVASPVARPPVSPPADVAAAAREPDAPSPPEASPAGEPILLQRATTAEAAAPDAPELAAAAEPLVSPTVSASVESSFNALSTSVFMQNSGLSESMVKDMVKPMLKAWLDEHLPSIVERLVRIEIERVARGSKA